VHFFSQICVVMSSANSDYHGHDYCDTPVSPRVFLRMPNQESLFYENQSKHEHQNNLSGKEFTKYILKSVMIKTIETFER
jgi:hypothetical protein